MIIMFTYIKKEIPGYFFRPEEPLTPENCDVLGSTYEDFLDGKFVPLNEAQITFSNEHPDAQIKNIWYCEEQLIDEVRNTKLLDLEQYDNSDSVNQFTINGIGTWFTPIERSNYTSSISAAKILGVENLTFYIESTAITVPTTQAEWMLAAVQLYADQCYITTKQHEYTIKQLESIDEIKNYDFTTNYPDKLEFMI